MEGRNTDAVELNIVWMWTGAPGFVSPAQRGWWMLAGAGLMSRKPAVMNSPPVEYAEFCFIRCGRSGVQLTDFLRPDHRCKSSTDSFSVSVES